MSPSEATSSALELVGVAHACSPGTVRRKQDDHKFKALLVEVESSRPTRAVYRNLVSTNRQVVQSCILAPVGQRQEDRNEVKASLRHMRPCLSSSVNIWMLTLQLLGSACLVSDKSVPAQP